MGRIRGDGEGEDFLKSLGFPTLEVHETSSHFDFTAPSRRVLLIGPMGSGKTEAAARIWSDAKIALEKGGKARESCMTGSRDRRRVMFIRSELDLSRFQEYPDDALSYRSGYIRCGTGIARIHDSFDFENVLKDNPEVGTFIIDEASFFDERLAYIARNYAIEEGCMFVFPTLVLNFRREFFNPTARLILDMATDVIPFTAYCDHRDCLDGAFYTYRYYDIEGEECPALYFDPLIVVGGDRKKSGGVEPNYSARCERHHYLPGKEYTFFTLRPLAERASRGDEKAFLKEIAHMKSDKPKSELWKSLQKRYKGDENERVYMNSLRPDLIAEKALSYVFSEQLIGETLLKRVAKELELDISYLEKTLLDNRRPVQFSQMELFD